MDEYDDLDMYNGDTAHDMNVDFDYYMNTGRPPFRGYPYVNDDDAADFVDLDDDI